MAGFTTRKLGYNPPFKVSIYPFSPKFILKVYLPIGFTQNYNIWRVPRKAVILVFKGRRLFYEVPLWSFPCAPFSFQGFLLFPHFPPFIFRVFYRGVFSPHKGFFFLGSTSPLFSAPFNLCCRLSVSLLSFSAFLLCEQPPVFFFCKPLSRFKGASLLEILPVLNLLFSRGVFFQTASRGLVISQGLFS